MPVFTAPLYDVVVDFVSHVFAAVKADNSQSPNWNIVQNTFITA